MPRYTRMKTIFLQGVIWLCLLNLGFVLSAIEPGYLDFDNLPDTNFSCVGKVIGGYYADLETNCQMFHVCTIGQLDEPMDIRFLCLNGTVFDQETRVCERVDEVDCSKSERFYHLNLELYGNTAPPILEESEETEPPIISSTTSTTTTTQRPTTTTRATRATFYTTPAPTLPTTTHSSPKVITSNQFPINSGPDIRFNPEEINIRLTPGSPPIIKSPAIKSPSVSYQQQAFNGGDARITVTTHTAVYKDEKIATSQKSVQNLSPSTQKPKSVVSYGLTHSNQQQMYHHKPQFDYNFQQTENSDIDYHTDLPSSEYAYHDDHIYDQMNYQSSNKKPQIFVSSTTKGHQQSFVSSTGFPPALKQQQYYQRTDKPPNLQLPVPLFPTLPPLTFSSPAPFTLTRHFEQKRSNDHQQRPRIIVSASASVSDASGRRLNYSLGTIGTSHLIPKAPHTYDEYKEDDVGLDPFYHDVPKVKSRQRRDLTPLDLTTLDLPEKKVDADDLSQETETTTHWTPPEYVDDNYEPLTYNVSEKTPEQNKTEVVTSKLNEKLVEQNDTKIPEVEYEYYYEYIDDNYEPSMYNETKNTTEMLTTTEVLTEASVQTTTEVLTEASVQTTTEVFTEPSVQTTTDNSTEDFTESSVQTTTDCTSTEVTVTEPYQDLMVSDGTTPSETEIPEFRMGVTSPTEEVTTNTILMERRSDILEEQTTVPTTTENETEATTTVTENIPDTTTVESTESTTPFESTTESIPNEEIASTISTVTTDNPTTEYIPETTTYPTTTTNRYSFLKPREPSFKRNSKTRPTPRHRFSSPSIHISPSVLKLGSKKANPISEESISEELSHRIRTNNIISDSQHILTTVSSGDVVTEAPLSKSANPTEPKTTKGSSMPTTPITKTLFIPRRFTYDVTRSFNCFGKELNQFYEDPRDCRLFHYCTPGYTKTQVLDMKYVCDYGTYFDSDKLICTKIKPQRCKVSGKDV